VFHCIQLHRARRILRIWNKVGKMLLTPPLGGLWQWRPCCLSRSWRNHHSRLPTPGGKWLRHEGQSDLQNLNTLVGVKSPMQDGERGVSPTLADRAPNHHAWRVLGLFLVIRLPSLSLQTMLLFCPPVRGSVVNIFFPVREPDTTPWDGRGYLRA
jgi:hypothetical protein